MITFVKSWTCGELKMIPLQSCLFLHHIVHVKRFVHTFVNGMKYHSSEFVNYEWHVMH